MAAPLQPPHGWAVLAGPCSPSELLEPTVHLPLALLPSPGPALGAEPLQVLLEVLVVHGAVALGLTEALGEQELGSPHWSKRGQAHKARGYSGYSHQNKGLCVQGCHPKFPGRQRTG